MIKLRQRRKWVRPRGSLFFGVTAVVLLAVVSVAAVTGVLMWIVWDTNTAYPWQELPSTVKNQEPPRPLDIIKVSLAVVAGLGAAVALVTGYRRQSLAEREERATDLLRFDQRFGSAAAQLGGTSPQVRLAGVYALASLADQYADNRQQCVDVLCGYLRLPFDPKLDQSSESSTEIARTTTDRVTVERTATNRQTRDREVRMTITTVIAAHLQDPRARNSWSHLDFNFEGAHFVEPDFTDAIFLGGARFGGATFVGSASFLDVEFAEGAWFVDAKFGDGAHFKRTNFGSEGAQFMDTTFGDFASFEGAEFGPEGGDFEDATFGGFASFKLAGLRGQAVFMGASFGEGVSFKRVKFGLSANFIRARFANAERDVVADVSRNHTNVMLDGATFSPRPPALRAQQD